MVFQCASCEIKGGGLQVWASSEDHCKSQCLETKRCKGVDYDIPFQYRCILKWGYPTWGTKHRVGFKAFRKDTCPGDTLSINDYYSLKMSFYLFHNIFLNHKYTSS